MTHTKWPWRVEVNDGTTSVESDIYTIVDDVSNNDAYLIAAAPDMLAALKLAAKSTKLSKALQRSIFLAVQKAEGKLQ